MDRNAFRLAIGQLADYRRFLEDHECAILLPAKPSADLLNLGQTQRIGVIWPVGNDFAGTVKLW